MLGEPAEQARRQDRVLVAILAGQVSRAPPGVGGPPVGEPAQRDHLAVWELSVQVRELGPEPDSDPCQLGSPLAAASGEALGEGAPHGLGDRHDEGLCGQGPLGGWDEGLGTFVHTVLVDTRARLRRSERPNRVLDVTVETARAAGLVGTRRVLDSTALYDAVATMDTVTLVRSAIRALLAKAPPELEAEIRQVLCRDDDYATPGKPPCDWQDPAAREALIDALAKDAMAALAVLDGRTLDPEMAEAAELLAAVVGQDLDRDHTDGVFR